MNENHEKAGSSRYVPEYLITWKLINEKRILDLSHGEVKVAETLNYRSFKPVQNGLFGENIFGPVESYKCKCGQLKGVKFKGEVCNRCGVTLENNRVRREWFGHISLNCKVVWPMFLKGNPSVLAVVLDMPQSLLMHILYGGYRVDVDRYWDAKDNKNDIVIPDKEFTITDSKYMTGVDAIWQVLMNMDLDQEISYLESAICNEEGYLSIADKHRLEVLSSFRTQNIIPADLVTSKILVIPADLRPILMHDGEIVSADINRHYLKIINRNNLLKSFMHEDTPEIILNSQRRLIQQSVNLLFDSCFYSEDEDDNRGNLLNCLRKKKTRYLDYSGKCSVLQNGKVPIDTLLLPVSMLLELYKPFVAAELTRQGKAHNIAGSRKMIERRSSETLGVLLDVLKKRYIMVENSQNYDFVGLRVSISTDEFAYIHPYTFNYLGLKVYENDHLKVFVPVSDEANKELESKLSLKNNLLSYYSGRLKLIPDDVTLENVVQASHINQKEQTHYCISRGEAFLKADQKLINKNTKLLIRCDTDNGFIYREETTLGRILLNECLPQDLGRINRKSLRQKYLLEFNCEFTRKSFMQLLEEIYDKKGAKNYLETITKLYNSFSGEDPGDVYKESVYIQEYKHVHNTNNEIDVYKSLFAGLVFEDKYEGDVERVLLEQYEGKLHPFIRQMLYYKYLAEDVYSRDEVVYKEGTLLTDDVLDHIYESTNSIVVYKVSLSENVISAKGYGGRTPKSGLQSFQALYKTLGYLSEIGEDRNFISVLFGIEPIKLSNNFIVQYYKIPVPEVIKIAFGSLLRDDKYLCLDDMKRFKKDIQFLLKAYICFIILTIANVKIDFRHVELWINIFQSQDYMALYRPLCESEDISLEMLAEYAIRGGAQRNLNNNPLLDYSTENSETLRLLSHY